MFILKKQTLDAISQGITYLSQMQQKDGSFLSLSSPNPTDFTNALQFHSTFSTSLILDSLSFLTETQELHQIKQKATSFLLKQKSRYWSFNYWARESLQAKQLPYPDDLDDTTCALAALFHYNNKIIDGSALAHVINLLTMNEVKTGGPYRTWLVSEEADNIWKDVDIAVNSNIAYFLSLYDIALPQLTNYIETNIINNKLHSPYYPSIHPIIYFISRFYKGKYQNNLIKFLFAKKYNWGNPINTALTICSLINLQTSVDIPQKAIEYLLQNQINGFWKPYPFYTGVNPQKDKNYYAGSTALTTALCLEALYKYLQIPSRENKETKKVSDTKESQMHKKIMKNVEKRFAFLDSDTKEKVIKVIKKMFENDKQQQISLLPYYFANALGKKKKNISEDFIIALGTANVFGWLAYTIYDNFFDDEGDSQLLSVANIALGSVYKIYENILPDDRFREIFHDTMNNLEYANIWESMHCKIKISKGKVDFSNFVIPDYLSYDTLAQKSLGHALGPLAVLFFLSYTKNSTEVKKTLLFFKHYLIARQLNDDAHDWEDDLLKGHCNSVGSLLLKRYYNHERSSKNESTIKKNIKELQKLFWSEVITEVCSLVNYHTKKARNALYDCPLIVNPHMLEQMLVIYEQAVKLTLDERKNTLKFLQTYNPT